METYFGHEKLDVYKASIKFVSWTEDLLERLPKSLAVRNQLDRASTSIPLNLAEGNGKFTDADRCRFFDIARGSALECAACLDVLVAKNCIDCAVEGKAQLLRIVSMLVRKPLRGNYRSRVYEEQGQYRASTTEN